MLRRLLRARRRACGGEGRCGFGVLRRGGKGRSWRCGRCKSCGRCCYGTFGRGKSRKGEGEDLSRVGGATSRWRTSTDAGRRPRAFAARWGPCATSFAPTCAAGIQPTASSSGCGSATTTGSASDLPSRVTLRPYSPSRGLASLPRLRLLLLLWSLSPPSSRGLGGGASVMVRCAGHVGLS